MHAMKSTVDCGRLPSLPNGNVATPSGITAGNVALYLCDEGLVLTGPPARVCGNNGLWAPGTPTCEGEDQELKCLTRFAYCMILYHCKLNEIVLVPLSLRHPIASCMFLCQILPSPVVFIYTVTACFVGVP